MINDTTDRFGAAGPDTVSITVNGREYEFHGDDLLALKAAFDDLEIAGAEAPDAEWSAEDFRDTLEGGE